MQLNEDDLTRLIAGLRGGDSVVLSEFWNHYGPLLTRIADRKLAAGMRRRFGPEDVVQSVCRTFFRRTKEGEFQFGSSDDLWRLLCAITLVKVREKTRFHLRQKRAVNAEVAITSPTESGVDRSPEATDPTPAEEVEFADLMQAILGSLDDEERQILELKLQDLTQDQIAVQLSCSERTVRRILKRIQAKLERSLLAEA